MAFSNCAILLAHGPACAGAMVRPKAATTTPALAVRRVIGVVMGCLLERRFDSGSLLEDFTRAFVRRLTGGHRSGSAPPLCKWASPLSSGLYSAVIRATQGRAMVIAAAASRGVGNSPRQ